LNKKIGAAAQTAPSVTQKAPHSSIDALKPEAYSVRRFVHGSAVSDEMEVNPAQMRRLERRLRAAECGMRRGAWLVAPGGRGWRHSLMPSYARPTPFQYDESKGKYHLGADGL